MDCDDSTAAAKIGINLIKILLQQRVQLQIENDKVSRFPLFLRGKVLNCLDGYAGNLSQQTREQVFYFSVFMKTGIMILVRSPYPNDFQISSRCCVLNGPDNFRDLFRIASGGGLPRMLSGAAKRHSGHKAHAR